MTKSSPADAPKHKTKLSFRTMKQEALYLIIRGCIEKRIYDPIGLALRTGLSLEKATSICRNIIPPPDQDDVPPLTGLEWDSLFSATGVSLQTWVEISKANSPDNIPDGDAVETLSTRTQGCELLPDMNQLLLNDVLGFSSAFYLKASNVTLPKAQ